MVLHVALLVCQILVAIATIYGLYFLVTAFPLSQLPPFPKPTTDKIHRFAVLIFAKDEQAVIGQLLDSLRDQDYPDDAYDVFVTADNCTDDTARVAAEHGAIVWERHDLAHVGKGYALHWFFERFRVECAGRYDLCAVFDADNVVAPGFLTAMNVQRNLGYEVALGYRVGKNPTSSAVAGTSTLFWLLQTRLFHVGRVRRGLPCPTVGGTGFMFDLGVLPGEHWHTKSTCEDIEFTLHSIAAGHNVSLTYDAVFYDEQPITWMQSIKQRYRWSVGSLQMLRYGTPRLLHTFKERWRTTYDAVLFSLGALMAGVSIIASVIMTVLMAVTSGQYLFFVCTTVGGAIVAYLAVAAVARLVLFLEHQWWKGAWKAVAAFPIFMVTWSVLYVVVLFYRNSRWLPIPHTEALTLDDIAHDEQR